MSFIGPEGSKQLKLAARFLTAGIELAASILVGYFGGGLLDRWLGLAPYLSYAGLLLGIIAGFRNLFALAKTAQKQTDESPETPDKPPPDDPP